MSGTYDPDREYEQLPPDDKAVVFLEGLIGVYGRPLVRDQREHVVALMVAFHRVDDTTADELFDALVA